MEKWEVHKGKNTFLSKASGLHGCSLTAVISGSVLLAAGFRWGHSTSRGGGRKDREQSSRNEA